MAPYKKPFFWPINRCQANGSSGLFTPIKLFPATWVAVLRKGRSNLTLLRTAAHRQRYVACLTKYYLNL